MQCLEFNAAKGNESVDGRVRPEIVSEFGEKYATVIISNDNKLFRDHRYHIEGALATIEEKVHNLIEIYSKTFRVNFSFDLPSNQSSKETINIFETFLVKVNAVHRLDVNWPAYKDFKVRMQIFHGTRPVTEPLMTPLIAKTESFFERLVFDSYLETKPFRVCSLPREARLIFTLIGRQQVSSSDKEGNRKSNEFVYVSKEIGWTSLQLFSFDLILAQGTYVLPFWPMECEQQIGPAPDAGSHPAADSCPSIEILLPEIGTPLKFPEDVPPTVFSPDSHNFEGKITVATNFCGIGLEDYFTSYDTSTFQIWITLRSKNLLIFAKWI